MGQKVHPKSLRLGIIQSWDSTWFSKKGGYAENVKEDYNLRKFLHKRYKSASLSRVEIDRKAQKLILRLVTGRPGMIVGRGGQGLDTLRKDLQSKTNRKDIQLDVLEVARVDSDAQLVSESIAQQLEKRVAFRRAIKQAMQRALHSGVKGIKVMVSGRLGGAEIARTEWVKEGRIPLHTFRADIDYGFSEALTTFGIIGVKVWIFKGEILPGETAMANVKPRGERGGGDGDKPRGGGRGDGGRGRGGRGGGGRGGRKREDGQQQPVAAATEGNNAPQPEAQAQQTAEQNPTQENKES